MAAIVRSLWLSGRVGAKVLDLTAEELRYTQARIAQARRSHRKTTIRKLHALGIRLTDLHQCRWEINSAL